LATSWPNALQCAQFVTGFTKAFLQPPPSHAVNILVAAQSKPRVNGFDDSRACFPRLADLAEAEKFIAVADE